MSALNIICDVKQGYQFQTTATTTFGYLTELSLEGKMLTVDQMANPVVVNGPAAVAVLSSVKWAGGVTDPITFVGQVSQANIETIAYFKQQSSPGNRIRFKFLVYAYDKEARQCFVEFTSGNAEMIGIIAGKSDALELGYNLIPMPYPPSPATNQFNVTILPDPEYPPQVVQVASSATAKVVRSWGVAVAH